VLYLLDPEQLESPRFAAKGYIGVSTVGFRSRWSSAVRSASRRSPTNPRGVAGRKPSARYLRLLVEGAREHGLPREYVTFLESHELARDERQQEDAMTKKSVRFYFAYNSPYSFLASGRIERELAPAGAGVEYKPVYSPRTGGAPDLKSPRFRYLFEDVQRFAEAYGLPLNPGPFADSKKACCGFFFAQEKGRVPRTRRRVPRPLARGEGHRAGGDAGEVAERAGLAREELLAALRDARYERRSSGARGCPRRRGLRLSLLHLRGQALLGQRPDRVAGARDQEGLVPPVEDPPSRRSARAVHVGERLETSRQNALRRGLARR